MRSFCSDPYGTLATTLIDNKGYEDPAGGIRKPDIPGKFSETVVTSEMLKVFWSKLKVLTGSSMLPKMSNNFTGNSTKILWGSFKFIRIPKNEWSEAVFFALSVWFDQVPLYTRESL